MHTSMLTMRIATTVRRLRLPAVLASISMVTMACGGKQELAPPDVGGVALTFDDSGAMGSWKEARRLLASYGAKATFFVDYPDNLSTDNLQVLRDLVADGHEIGCHGYRHHAMDWFTNRNDPVSAFVKHEVSPAITAMRKRGFPPRSFAYPYGSHTKESDLAVAQLFQVVRTTRRDASMVPPDGRSVVGAIFIDDNHRPGWPEEYLDQARTSGATVVFCGHSIAGPGDAPGKCVTGRTTLDTICSYVTNHGMRFRTVSELAPRPLSSP